MMNAAVSRKSSIYSKSTDTIQREQATARADARGIRVATWLMALLFPLIIGGLLAAYFGVISFSFLQ